VNHLQI